VTEQVQASLRAALADLAQWLDEAGVSSMIIGGVAASVLGQLRLTQDIDVLAIAPESRWIELLNAGARHGITPRIPDTIAFAARSRVLLMRHEASGIDIDLTLGGLAFEEAAVSRSRCHAIGGLTIRLPSVEDLLVMKAVAGRPKDIQDIEGLLAANPNVDVTFVRHWVREFATAMSMPTLLEELEKVLAKPR
jgi:predicted nucleotidyltransferase